MDLVEIRKKAKSRRKKTGPKADSTSKKPGRAATAPPQDEDRPEEAVTAGADGEAADLDQTADKAKETEPATKEVDAVTEEPIAMKEDQVDSLDNLRDVLQAQQVEKREEEEEEQLQLLTFMLGGEEYALNIMDIKEIIRPREVTEVPRAPAYITGIISLRGTIIPIIDVNSRLGLSGTESSPQNRIVVVKSQDHLFGLRVDSVVQVMDLPLSRIEPPPEILGGVEGEFLRGVGRVDDRLIILLNLGRILAIDDMGQAQDPELPAGTEGE